MSRNSEFLEKRGWRRISRKKNGMMIIERWVKPGTEWIHGVNQAQALLIENPSKRKG